MSFSITLTVEDGVPVVASFSTGDAAPPDGAYSIGGHVHHGTDSPPSLGLQTPIGSVNTYLTSRASEISE